MAGPLTHSVVTLLVCRNPVAGLWMDAVPTRRGREWSHGLPGLALAVAIGGKRWALAWALHVAVDTMTHAPGEGAAGQRKWFWTP